MKTRSLLAAGTMLLLPALAFAGQKNSTHVQFEDAVSVAGTRLAAGEYKVTWQGNGPDVTVSFIEGKKVVATAPARLVNQRLSEPARSKPRREATRRTSCRPSILTMRRFNLETPFL